MMNKIKMIVEEMKLFPREEMIINNKDREVKIIMSKEITLTKILICIGENIVRIIQTEEIIEIGFIIIIALHITNIKNNYNYNAQLI